MTIVDVQLHTVCELACALMSLLIRKEGAGLFCKKYAVYEIDVVQDGTLSCSSDL